MTAIATVILAGFAVTAKAQYGHGYGHGYAHGYAPRAYAPAYGYYHPRDVYRDERVIRRDRYDLYQDRAYGNRFDARVDRGRLDRAYNNLGHDHRDFRRGRW